MDRNGAHSRFGRCGFTLVEVLIVVVILGILATAVIPMVSSASTDAIKSALRRQIQTIDHQIEIYRVSNQGVLPTLDPVSPMGGLDNGGWGILVSADYLKEAPFNGYIGQSALAAGDEPTAQAIEPPNDFGWYYEVSADGTQLFVYAAGYDKLDDLLAHEQ